MNKDLKLQIDVGKLLSGLSRYAKTLAFVIVMAAAAYTVWQIYTLVNIQLDQNYITKQAAKKQAAVTKIDTATIQSLEQLHTVNVQPDTSNLGRNDPFAP